MPPNPQNTRKFHFFFPKTPPFWVLPAEKRVTSDRVTLCFSTVSDLFSQKIAARCSSGTFFSIFSKLSGLWRGTNALRRCPALQGAGHDTADFGVIWVPFFFDKNRLFFKFDFDKTWFGGGLGPLAVEKKIFCGLFFSLRAL